LAQKKFEKQAIRLAQQVHDINPEMLSTSSDKSTAVQFLIKLVVVKILKDALIKTFRLMPI
jgi:hypothetical protein